MAELSKLTDRILDEAKRSADDILSEAKDKVKKIELSSENQCEAKYKSMVEKGAREAESLKERLVSNANLKARDGELKVKQEVIQRVFEAALKDMKEIGSEKYVEYIKNNLSFSEDSILVVQQDKLDVVKSVFPNVKVLEDRFTESGFIEVTGGIEKNYTFDTQLNYIKDEVQGEIAKVLFK